MNIHLTHPKHGQKFATHEGELEQDLENGWKRADVFPEPEEQPPVEPPMFHVKQRGRPRKYPEV